MWGRHHHDDDDHRRRDHHDHHEYHDHHDYDRRGNSMDYFARKPTYRVYCKAGGDRFQLAVRENRVLLVYADHHHDTQHWYKDERFASRAKDEEGHHSFALVNKATGQVIKHSVVGERVTLVRYDPDDGLDISLLWTESNDVGEGFKNIRMVNDIKLCMDAFHGDSDHGGVRDGTEIALYECWNGENQQWRIVPYSNSCQDPLDDPNKFILETTALRKTLELVIKEVDEEQRKRGDQAWEMVNYEVVGQQSEEEPLKIMEVDIHNINEPRRTFSREMANLQGVQEGNCSVSMGLMFPPGDNSQREQQVRQRLGNVVANPLLETRSGGIIFIPQWEITMDDCLTDAFSERSIGLCHQWCKGIVPPKDYNELLGMELHELYQWADYHKAQAHIFEMIAREKANLLFLGEQALREDAEKRLAEERSRASQNTSDLEITDKVSDEQIERIRKLEKEKGELAEQLRNLEIKCSQQEVQLKDQANSFESQLEELKKEEQESHLKNASLNIASLYEDLEERRSQLTILKKSMATLEARSAQLLKQKMEIVIKAIMKRHQDLEWGSILDEIDRMDAKLTPLSVSNAPLPS
ncbi:hypothetical protein Cgig2_023483 [Carnegiea gigantea]|uniref:Ricin B lectin domain-containing protein n=1 Tax=Carnegiea gigantea TaxID=171969 RepID=A0A9Q1JVI2_9CARY|nr:hypothetical protein Cgig2_023483 [Carnegiea gigantea]